MTLVFDDYAPENLNRCRCWSPSERPPDLEWRYAHNVPHSFADGNRRVLPVLLITVRRLSSHFGQRKFRLRIAAQVVRADLEDATPVAVSPCRARLSPSRASNSHLSPMNTAATTATRTWRVGFLSARQILLVSGSWH